MAISSIDCKYDIERISLDLYRGTTITEQEESSSSRSASDIEPPPYEENAIRLLKNSIIGPSTDSLGLSKPIAIPATNADLGSAFLRAYPPVLVNFDISRDVFLEFLDRLNRGIVASPPMRVLGFAADVVGFVPEPTAQIVSVAAGIGATIGTFAMSKIRGEVIIRQANKEIFFPKGLEVRIAKLKTVAKLANMPVLNDKGDVDKQSPILESLQALADTNELTTISAQERRLRALETWISPLDVEELPAVANPASILSKVDVFVSETERKSAEKSMLKKRVRVTKKHEKESQKALSKYESSLERFEEKERSVNAHGRHASRDMERLEDRRQKATLKYEKEVEKAHKHYQKKDKEERNIRRIYFLVIVPKSQDS